MRANRNHQNPMTTELACRSTGGLEGIQSRKVKSLMDAD